MSIEDTAILLIAIKQILEKKFNYLQALNLRNSTFVRRMPTRFFAKAMGLKSGVAAKTLSHGLKKLFDCDYSMNWATQ